MTEAWATDDELRAAREHFASLIPGWHQPVIHGLVTTAGGVSRVQVVSGLDHRLPAVVLCSIIGRAAGTQTVQVTAEQLAEAIDLLTPAEAALHMPHPNLWTWRRVLAEGADLIEAVFIDDLSDPVSSTADALLRRGL